jgi:hypothetical protein
MKRITTNFFNAILLISCLFFLLSTSYSQTTNSTDDWFKPLKAGGQIVTQESDSTYLVSSGNDDPIYSITKNSRNDLFVSNKIILYPNPVTEGGNIFLEVSEKGELMLFDIYGRKLGETNTTQKEYEIKVSPGIVLLVFKNNEDIPTVIKIINPGCTYLHFNITETIAENQNPSPSLSTGVLPNTENSKRSQTIEKPANTNPSPTFNYIRPTVQASTYDHVLKVTANSSMSSKKIKDGSDAFYILASAPFDTVWTKIVNERYSFSFKSSKRSEEIRTGIKNIPGHNNKEKSHCISKCNYSNYSRSN